MQFMEHKSSCTVYPPICSRVTWAGYLGLSKAAHVYLATHFGIADTIQYISFSQIYLFNFISLPMLCSLIFRYCWECCVIVACQGLTNDFNPIKILAFAYEPSLNGGQLLFETGKVLVEGPDKGLIGPEGRIRSLLVSVGGTRARWARLSAVPSYLINELLQPEHRLPVSSDMLQQRAQTVLQHRGAKEYLLTAKHVY